MSSLDDKFTQGIAYVQNSTGVKLSQVQQLRFYGLYKIATAGTCDKPAPSAFKIVEYKKWGSWKKISDSEKLTKEQAKQAYVDELTKLVPNWADAKL